MLGGDQHLSLLESDVVIGFEFGSWGGIIKGFFLTCEMWLSRYLGLKNPFESIGGTFFNER